MDAIHQAMEAVLKEGQDVLYLAFSSGLSGTYNNARLAAEELAPLYPERKIIAIDSLCASLGFGLWVHRAVTLRDAGKSLEETAKYLTDHRQNFCHYFTVDDLNFLHRGGRVFQNHRDSRFRVGHQAGAVRQSGREADFHRQGARTPPIAGRSGEKDAAKDCAGRKRHRLHQPRRL